MLEDFTFTRILFLVFLLHLIADFVLQIQGRLCDFKCKRWWDEQIAKIKEDEQLKDKIPRSWWDDEYRHDYKCGLLIHALMWTLVTYSPFVFFGQLHDLVVWCLVAGNTAFHYWIDNMKANEYLINLWHDQILHLVQILLTIWFVFPHWL